MHRLQVEEMRRLAEEAELARIAEQEAREDAERQRKMQEAAAKQKAREEEIERQVRLDRPAPVCLSYPAAVLRICCAKGVSHKYAGAEAQSVARLLAARTSRRADGTLVHCLRFC